MVAMKMHNKFIFYYHVFWLFIVVVDADIIDSINANSAPVFFRWSAGFERNFQAIRCATDQSSEDPFNRLVDVYPEMQSLYQKPKNFYSAIVHALAIPAVIPQLQSSLAKHLLAKSFEKIADVHLVPSESSKKWIWMGLKRRHKMY
jgi:hypothetical protein